MTKLVRQGDILLRKTDKIPAKAKRSDDLVLAYGEVTGHRHRLVGQVQVFRDQESTYVLVEKEAKLVHEEHKPIDLDAGSYVVVREREWDPIEEARRVSD